MLGELLHLLRSLEKRAASASVTDSIAHRLANPVASSPIQSIQRGTIAITTGGTGQTSGTATISSVNTAKAVCLHGGVSTEATAGARISSRAALTAATTVTAYADTASSGVLCNVNWEVLEFK